MDIEITPEVVGRDFECGNPFGLESQEICSPSETLVKRKGQLVVSQPL